MEAPGMISSMLELSFLTGVQRGRLSGWRWGVTFSAGQLTAVRL